MRRFMLVAAMLGTVSAAQAADMPDLPILRGAFTDGLSKTSRNWDGFYVGGQIGYTSADMDFSHAPGGMTGFMLRNSVLQAPVSSWGLLSKNHAQANGFGAFVGRNWQWYDAVLGVEANYNYMNNLASSSSDSMTRLIVSPAGEVAPAGHTHSYNTTLTGSAALQVKDVVTFRGRVGWAGGDFLPYAFGGLAVGRVAASRSATVSYDKYDDWDETVVVGGISGVVHHTDYLGSASQSQTEQRVNSFVTGWTAGLGAEYMIWNCIFLRGEWEYIRFSSVKDINFSTNNFRLGAGYKF
ncbi:outer membrane protein [Bradyrhizobium liaoningense]|uniref:outer membrane protein n=1 Tax=Bradyrhizobium liaoningense TaxID=43992 RepID=UPI001BAC2984|nr:outer membrane beta-barrel protein [Bradyrhizobium liaoningense]MBR0717617.1 porin family protein [Bradyrhizobium liaoningense]